MAKVDSIARIIALANSGNSGGGTATTNYIDLINKPKINGVTLEGNVSLATIGVDVTSDDVLTKDSNTPYTPTQDYNPATKKYVDDEIAKLGTIDVIDGGVF